MSSDNIYDDFVLARSTDDSIKSMAEAGFRAAIEENNGSIDSINSAGSVTAKETTYNVSPMGHPPDIRSTQGSTLSIAENDFATIDGGASSSSNDDDNLETAEKDTFNESVPRNIYDQFALPRSTQGLTPPVKDWEFDIIEGDSSSASEDGSDLATAEESTFIMSPIRVSLGHVHPTQEATSLAAARGFSIIDGGASSGSNDDDDGGVNLEVAEKNTSDKSSIRTDTFDVRSTQGSTSPILENDLDTFKDQISLEPYDKVALSNAEETIVNMSSTRAELSPLQGSIAPTAMDRFDKTPDHAFIDTVSTGNVDLVTAEETTSSRSLVHTDVPVNDRLVMGDFARLWSREDAADEEDDMPARERDISDVRSTQESTTPTAENKAIALDNGSVIIHTDKCTHLTTAEETSPPDIADIAAPILGDDTGMSTSNQKDDMWALMEDLSIRFGQFSLRFTGKHDFTYR